MQSLDENQVSQKLKSLTGWSLVDGKLHRTLECDNFQKAFSIMTHIAFVAEKMDHHPEWKNVYNKIEIDLITHDAGPGITEKDFTLAEAVNTIVKNN